MKDAVGEAHAGGHFIAITDPDSALQHLAERERFRQVFFGVPGIGGRYSALSNFGMVPAALMGVDVGRLARPHGTDGALLCGERPRRRESGGRPGRDPGHAGRRRP